MKKAPFQPAQKHGTVKSISPLLVAEASAGAAMGKKGRQGWLLFFSGVSESGASLSLHLLKLRSAKKKPVPKMTKINAAKYGTKAGITWNLRSP
jgi:hypothetical protein